MSQTSQEPPIHQACAVPYRWRDAELEFCLITSSRKGRWGFPKGIVDPGDTPRETAAKEAWEEAGLMGRIEGKPLGRYDDHKWGRELLVVGYLMRVMHSADGWPEAPARKRRWLPASEAAAKIHRKEQLALLRVAMERLATGHPNPAAASQS